jgi:glycosyltransferase involved in cell wall biosynthesis
LNSKTLPTQKIAWIVPKQFNRFDSRIVKQATSLIKRGYLVRIYSMVEYKDAVLNDNYKDINIIRINHPWLEKIGFPVSKMRLLMPFFTIKIFPRLVTYRPDIIYCSNLPSVHIGVIFKFFFRVKVIYDSHDLFIDQNSRKNVSRFTRRITKYYERLLSKKVDVVYQTTNSRCKKFIEYYGIAPKKVMNKPVVKKNREKVSHPLCELIDKENTVICYVGSIHPNRGLEHVIEAIKSIPRVIFIAIGPATGAWARNFIKSNKDILIWYPPVDSEDVVQIISHSDIGVSLIQNSCLSYYYSCPTKVFELICAGIPQIASNFPEIQKLIIDNEIGPLGKVVDPSNCDEIKDAIVELINNPLQYKSMRENCTKMQRYCSWESEEQKIVSVLENLY